MIQSNSSSTFSEITLISPLPNGNLRVPNSIHWSQIFPDFYKAHVQKYLLHHYHPELQPKGVSSPNELKNFGKNISNNTTQYEKKFTSYIITLTGTHILP
jgi:hypothetical protein